MVRIKRSYRIQVCGARSAPNGELPSDPPQTGNRQTPELCKKPVSQFIIAPPTQASRRCETQAPLGGKRQALLPFRSLDPFRALREPDRRRRDEERLSRSEQRTDNKPKHHLTGKAPYRFESISLHRRVQRTAITPSRHHRNAQSAVVGSSRISKPNHSQAAPKRRRRSPVSRSRCAPTAYRRALAPGARSRLRNKARFRESHPQGCWYPGDRVAIQGAFRDDPGGQADR
jgi:hypothetical protein